MLSVTFFHTQEGYGVKLVWYLVHNIRTETQWKCKGQKELIACLQRIGCKFDKSALAQIRLEAKTQQEKEDDDIGEFWVAQEGDLETSPSICVEELYG